MKIPLAISCCITAYYGCWDRFSIFRAAIGFKTSSASEHQSYYAGNGKTNQAGIFLNFQAT